MPLRLAMELWKPVPDGAREVPPGGICPKCRSPRVHRSRARTLIARALRAIGPYRPFACSACKWRGWAWPDASQGPVHHLPPVPVRAKRGSRKSGAKDGRKVYSPAELARQRYRRHVALAALLAALSGGALLYCQQEPETSAQQP